METEHSGMKARAVWRMPRRRAGHPSSEQFVASYQVCIIYCGKLGATFAMINMHEHMRNISRGKEMVNKPNYIVVLGSSTTGLEDAWD